MVNLNEHDLSRPEEDNFVPTRMDRARDFFANSGASLAAHKAKIIGGGIALLLGVGAVTATILTPADKVAAERAQIAQSPNGLPLPVARAAVDGKQTVATDETNSIAIKTDASKGTPAASPTVSTSTGTLPVGMGDLATKLSDVFDKIDKRFSDSAANQLQIADKLGKVNETLGQVSGDVDGLKKANADLAARIASVEGRPAPKQVASAELNTGDVKLPDLDPKENEKLLGRRIDELFGLKGLKGKNF